MWIFWFISCYYFCRQKLKNQTTSVSTAKPQGFLFHESYNAILLDECTCDVRGDTIDRRSMHELL